VVAVTTAPATPAVAPVAAPAPAIEAEPTISTLSTGAITSIASDHQRELSTCEGGAELHGDVSITFQVDAAGKVVKSQLSSSIKNAKVASCILRSLQAWHFPKPASGAAKGTYSLSYQ
jgi:hypothetical protein